jgi:hypothetical protein
LCCLLLPAKLQAATDVQDVDSILTAAESVFLNMSQAAYPALWTGLSTQSRKSIIRNVRKALNKAGLDYSEDRISADFEKGGEIAGGYWKGYLSEFDPKTVLEGSKWSMGEVRKDRAEIIIRYKKSQHDAILQMFREEGVWKAGLSESFATRMQ